MAGSSAATHEDEIRAWAINVAQDSVETNNPPSPSIPAVEAVSLHDEDDPHGEMSLDAVSEPTGIVPVSNVDGLRPMSSSSSLPAPSIRYFVLQSLTCARIMAATATSRWPVPSDLCDRMSKALRDHEILIVFLFARDTRHFALCAHVTAVTTHHSGIQVEAITPALALEDLILSGNADEVSAGSATGDHHATPEEEERYAREFKERGLEASIWNLSKDQWALNRRRKRLMAELAQVRQEFYPSNGDKGAAKSVGSSLEVEEHESKVIAENQESAVDQTLHSEANTNGNGGILDQARLKRSSAEKSRSVEKLRCIAHTQSWQASQSKQPKAPSPPQMSASPSLANGKASAQTNRTPSSGSPLQPDSMVNSDLSDTIALQSTPKMSDATEPSANLNTHGGVSEATVNYIPPSKIGVNRDVMVDTNFPTVGTLANARKIDEAVEALEDDSDSFIVWNALLMTPLPFTEVTKNQIRNSWHGSSTARPQRDRFVHKVADGTELALDVGHKLFCLWAALKNTPVCPTCSRHWSHSLEPIDRSVTESGFTSSETDSDEL